VTKVSAKVFRSLVPSRLPESKPGLERPVAGSARV
jgi:hypothetical protein